jgi:DNA-binding transcriptional regulator YiaG
MSTFANQLKAEIARISKKENKAENAALKKASAQYRSDIAALKRRIATLESMFSKMNKQAVKSGATDIDLDSDEKSLRFRVAGFASLRKKLGLTANEMGTLLGVSGQSVYKWEQGKAKPRATQMQAIAAVRKLGKKQVAELLAAG